MVILAEIELSFVCQITFTPLLGKKFQRNEFELVYIMNFEILKYERGKKNKMADKIVREAGFRYGNLAKFSSSFLCVEHVVA